MNKKMQDLERLNSLVLTQLNKFFSFQIEESELRKSLHHVVGFDIGHYVHRHQPSSSSPPTPPRKEERTFSEQGGEGEGESSSHSHSHSGTMLLPYNSKGEVVEDLMPTELLLPPLQHRELNFRIRGKEGAGEGGGGFRRIQAAREEEEVRLVEQLKEAKRRMKKHMKLQVSSASSSSRSNFGCFG